MSRIYRDIVCRTCNDTFVVDHSIDDPFQCSGCQYQTSKDVPEGTCVAHADSCGDDLDNDLLADMKEQLDAANEFWYEAAFAGWYSEAKLKYALESKERDLENERKAGDALNASLADMKEQLDFANESSEFWYQQAIAGWCSVAEMWRKYLDARRP